MDWSRIVRSSIIGVSTSRFRNTIKKDPDITKDPDYKAGASVGVGILVGIGIINAPILLLPTAIIGGILLKEWYDGSERKGESGEETIKHPRRRS